MTNGRQRLDELAPAYAAEPDDEGLRRTFVAALVARPEHSTGPALDRALAVLAGDDRVDHQRLVRVAVHRVLARPGVTTALAAVARGEPPAAPDMEAAVSALADPLSQRILADHIYASSPVEMLLTALRNRWLEAAADEAQHGWPATDLLAAVALQMQTTEWVYAAPPNAVARLAGIAGRVRDASGGDDRLRTMLVFAMFRPLDELRDTVAVPPATPRLADVVLRRHLEEPVEERLLAEGVPRLTPITDAVSQLVRSQYEDRPYPRWRHVAMPQPRLLGHVVAGAVADPQLATTIDVTAPEILVAGCGTGRHAVLTAARYPGSHVLAVDLSLPSLAYAASQKRRLGLTNLEFAQADVLHLGKLGRSFDLVEAVGVLHHMDDPGHGWKVLRSLVRPGGIMKLGLYSRRGRSMLDPITRAVKEQGWRADDHGIAEVRALVRRLSPDQPAHRLAETPDFYSRSGCRDLFFHAHEVRVSVPWIAERLAELDLEFLGFEVPSPRVRELYRSRFPDDPSGRQLANWDVLEQQYPLLFAAMYRFWVRTAES